MRKTDYQRPAMTVVELQHTGMLMEQSEQEPVRGGSRINNWKDGDTTDDDVYM